jgi:hypothetical protein
MQSRFKAALKFTYYWEVEMINDITRTTLNASMAAMMIAEMAYPKRDQQFYESIRPELAKLLSDIAGCEDVDLPASAQDLQDQMDAIVFAIMERLSILRSRVDGEVTPLTFFVLTYSVWRGMIFAAYGFNDHWLPYRTLLEHCWSDLGLDKNTVVPLLETKARALVQQGGEHDEYIRDSDRIEASVEYLSHVTTGVLERWSTPPSELGVQLTDLRNQIEAFRLEVHADHEHMFKLLAGLRQELVARLIDQGVDPHKAEAISNLESKGFLARLKRWSANKKARDAVEGALWAALDFVPGGTGLKLGIKVLRAVRQATK